MPVTLDDLAGLPIWLIWKAVPGQRADGSTKTDKPPIDPRTGYRGSKTNPAIRMTRSEAEAAAHKYGLVGDKGGIGLLMLPFELGGVLWQLGGLDTDHCYDEGAERHAPWADPVFAILDGHYTEASPSGTGRHHLFVIEADHILDGVGKDINYSLGAGGERHGFELYTRAPGYLTFTGRDVQGDLQAISPFTLMRLFNALEAFKPRTTKSKANGHFAQSDHDKALDILAHLPNAGDYNDYPKWVGVIAALHAATGGSEAGRRAAAAWSKDGGSRTAQEGVDVLYEYFDRVPPRADLGHLVNEARDHGYEPYRQQRNGHDRAPPPNGEDDYDRTSSAKGDDWTQPPTASVDIAAGDVARWIGQPVPDIEFVVRTLLPIAVAGLLAGDGGAGKSILAQVLATCVAAGLPFLGFTTMSGKAVYITGEDQERIAHSRQERMNAHFGITMEQLAGRLFIVARPDIDLFLFQDGRPTVLLASIAQQLEAIDGLRIVVIDSNAIVFDDDEIRRRPVRSFMMALNRIALRLNITILLITHKSRSSTSSPSSFASGSTGWVAHARAGLDLVKDETTGDVTVTLLKPNYSKDEKTSITCSWTEDGVLTWPRPDNLKTGVTGEIIKRNHEKAVLEAVEEAWRRKEPLSTHKRNKQRWLPGYMARLGKMKVAEAERAVVALSDRQEIVERRYSRTTNGKGWCPKSLDPGLDFA